MPDAERPEPSALGTPTLDALPPDQMAQRAAQVGEAKATMPFAKTFVLAVLAGAFIAMGAIFATTVTAGGTEVLGFGLNRLIGGVAFSLGLILVVVAGAELFTGNNLVVMAWASRRVSTRQIARNWAIVYVGNFVGALATVALMFASEQYTFGGGIVGTHALDIAHHKVGLSFGQAVFLGILCNALVCLAVWLTYGARSMTDKILAIIPPIAAFVAAGFEHSIANMYFVPMGLLIKTDEAFVDAHAEQLPELSELTWSTFLIDNLVPVTIGNMIGGALMVGAIYWFIYLRRPADESP